MGSIVNFGRAKIVVVNKTASYVELSCPEGNSQKCLFCAKTTAHEHDISGKVKFDPKQKSYLVSLIEKSVTGKTAKSLEIYPVKKAKEPIKEPQQTSQIYPVIVPDEASGAKYFAKELMSSKKVLSAIKVQATNDVHLLCGQPKSVLKSQPNCGKCDLKQFDTLSEVLSHFQNAHNYDIKIRDISIMPESQNGHDSSNLEEDSSIYSCTICQAEFLSDESRIKHSNEAHVATKEAQLQCYICLQFFKNQSSFRKHLTHEHLKEKVRKHTCHLCNKSFLKAPHLQAHVQTHMGAKLHPCEICDKRYASAFSLKMHRLNFHGVGGERPVCEVCKRSFYNNSFLRRHILEQHDRDPRLECKFCGHFYLRKDNLEAHVKNTHSDKAENHPCKLCSKSYSCSDKLSEHLRTSHGILPWNKVQVLQVTSKNHEEAMDQMEELRKELAGSLKCRYCEQTFLPTEMESHLRFSHGVMPFKTGTEMSISEAAEALLKTLTPQPDYLLRSLTPLPMETLDELIMDSALSKD